MRFQDVSSPNVKMSEPAAHCVIQKYENNISEGFFRATVFVQARSKDEVRFKIIPAYSREEMSTTKQKVQRILTITHMLACTVYGH